MTLATKLNNVWTELIAGNPIVHDDIVASWGTVNIWTEAEKNAFGVYTVQEAPATVTGKIAIPGPINDLNGKPVRSYTYIDTPPAPIESLPDISDRQFFQALASPPYSFITTQEALDAVKTGEIPPVMQDVIDALPTDQQFGATMLIAGATTFRRNNTLVKVFAASKGMTEADVDTFWRFAGSL